MILSSRHVLVTLLSLASVAGVVVACGSEGSTFPNGINGDPPVFSDGGFGDGSDYDPSVELYKNDPFPKWCGPEAGAKQPPVLSGTEVCPSDKNKPGCGCDTPGATAPCWEGLRRHRNLGICKDGVATCVARSETSYVWSECRGQKLPVVGGKGAEACSCFSAGTWKITNTSPCIYQTGGVYSSYSTRGDTAQGCNPPNGVPPGGPWSSNTLQVDCEGTFRLCFKIRAGDFKNPKADDCVLGEACVDATYLNKNQVQPLTDLPAWVGSSSACAKKWEQETPPDVSPGYGEMIVKGQSFYCDAIDDGSGNDLVFNRVQYCPRICRPSNPPSEGGYQPDAQICKDCQLSSQGQF